MEVVLAIGVVSFALIALIALIPLGIQSSGQSVEESRALNLLQEIVSDRLSTPFGEESATYALPKLDSGLTAPAANFFGAGENFQKTSSLSDARYRIDYAITPPAAGQLAPYVGWFKASWPAQAAAPEHSVEIVATFPQP